MKWGLHLLKSNWFNNSTYPPAYIFSFIVVEVFFLPDFKEKRFAKKVRFNHRYYVLY